MKLRGSHVFSLSITQLFFNTKFQEDYKIFNKQNLKVSYKAQEVLLFSRNIKDLEVD